MSSNERDGNRTVKRRGLMLILSSPSGAGKTTIAKALLEQDPNLLISVSCTTRPPRAGEVDGKDYYFIDAPTFKALVESGGFMEHAVVFDHSYGTPSKPVEEALAAGRDVLFDIDWQGTQQLAQTAPGDVVSVFILPPSTAELERRLRARAQDPDEVMQRRMAKAADEMSHWREYRYIIVNRIAGTSIQKAQAILIAERLKRDRQIGLADFVNDLRHVDA
ncbi:MAG: guanylate kinase [Proteobacteria bacterium]|nr:guanylate kinase [Pseudomonadota bacterium]